MKDDEFREWLFEPLSSVYRYWLERDEFDYQMRLAEEIAAEEARHARMLDRLVRDSISETCRRLHARQRHLRSLASV